MSREVKTCETCGQPDWPGDGCACDPEPVECPRCDGTGSITGDRYQPVDCGDCDGQGVVEAER